MDRRGNIMIFNEDEQAEFGVPAVIDVEIAVETAVAFQDASRKVDGNALETFSKTPHDSDTQAAHEAAARFARAQRLNSFGGRILDRCSDVIQNQIVSKLAK